MRIRGLLIFFVFVYSFNSVFAQLNSDSLEIELKSAADAKRVEILNILSDNYRKHDVGKTLEYAREAGVLALQLDLPDEYTSSLINMGSGYTVQLEADSALYYFNEASSNALKINRIDLLATAQNKTGIVYWKIGDYQKAIDWYYKANQTYLNSGDSLGMAKTTSNIGLIYREWGDFRKADSLTFLAISVYKKLNRLEFIGDCFNSIAISKYYLGEPDSIEIYYNKAQAAYTEVNDKMGVARVLHNLGIFFEEKQDHEKALQNYKKSLEMKLEIGNKPEISNSYQAMGTTLENMGKYNEALSYYLKSLQIAEEIESKSEIAYAKHAIGGLYATMGENEKALSTLGEVLKLRRELKEYNALCNTLNLMVTINLRLGNYDAAQKYASESLEMAKKSNSEFLLMNVNLTLGEVNLALNKPAQAINNFEKTLKVVEEFDNQSVEAQASLGLGQAYLMIQNQSLAEKYLLKAANIGKNYVLTEIEQTALLKLSEFYANNQKYQPAFNYLKRHTILKDSIFSDKNSRLLADLQTKYETEQKEKENELLKQKNEISELQISRQRNIIISGILGVIALIVVLTLIYYKHRLKLIQQKQAEEIEKERIKQELEQARDMQKSLLPSKLPRSDQFEVFAACNPANEVGGDFYDVGIHGDKLVISVADVSGKGMKAALSAVLSSGMLTQLNKIGIVDPAEVLTKINYTLHSKKSDKRIFTALCSSIISLEEKTLTFSNSGQPEILLCRDSKVSFLESLEPRLPLGMRKNLSYQNSFVKLQKNDTLLFFSDAVTESLNTSGKQFGYENIISSVERYSGGSIQVICNGLIRDLNSFIQDAGQYDDMTLVGIKIL